MKKIRASVILWLNLAVGFGLIIVFSVSTLTVSTRLNAESKARVQRTIAHFHDVFEQETSGLRDMVFLCKNNTAFISTVNSRSSEWNAISQYVTQTIHTLSIMQNAYDYVEGIYLYAPSVKRMIGAAGTIDTDYYDEINWIQQRLSSDEYFSNPFDLKEGWNSFENLAIYTVSIPANGRLLTLVRPEKMGDLETFSTIYPGQQMIVLDEQGEYFTSTIQGQYETLRSFELDLDSGEKIRLNDTVYRVERLDGFQFSYLLLTDIDSYEREYSRIAALSMSLCVAGLMLIMGLMLINGSFSKAISQSVGTRRHVGVSEIDQIAYVMLENEQFRRGELENAMRLLLEEKQNGVPARIAGIVAESFGSYVAVSLAVQRADGPIEAAQMDALMQFVADNVNSCAVRQDDYCVYFLAEVQPGTAVEAIVKRYFEALNDDLCVYVGVSGTYTNPYAIQSAMRQAQRRMMCASVPCGKEHCMISRHEEVGSRGMNEEQAEVLLGALKAWDRAAASEAFNCLIAGKDVPLHDLQRWILRLRAMLEGWEEDTDGAWNDLYHPSYALEKLLSEAERTQRLESEAPEMVYDEFREHVLEYMREHYMEDITLDSVAERFHVTAVHLSRWFKKANEINFSTYLSALRMNRACELLRDKPDMKITDVSLAVGIRNAATLTRQFKSFAGVTPEQYRRQCVMEKGEG